MSINFTTAFHNMVADQRKQEQAPTTEQTWTSYVDGIIEKIANKHPNFTAFYLNEVRDYADNYRAEHHKNPNAARLEYFANQLDVTTWE